MDNRYYKFLKLNEYGSFSEAAKQLKKSQPAITIAIASLEHSLGKKLIIRKKGSVELTPAGKIVLSASEKINNQINIMNSNLQKLNNNPVICIGLIDSIASLLYSAKTKQAILNNIEVMVDNSARIISQITTGQLDYGIVTGQAKSLPKDINIYKLKNEPFTFVSSPKNLNTIKNTVGSWLAYNKESTTYSYFSKEFMNMGLEAKPKFFSTSMELLKETAIAGEGTALLPKHFVNKDIKNGNLVVFKTKPLSRPIWLVSKKPLASNKQIKAITKKINTLLTK